MWIKFTFQGVFTLTEAEIKTETYNNGLYGIVRRGSY